MVWWICPLSNNSAPTATHAGAGAGAGAAKSEADLSKETAARLVAVTEREVQTSSNWRTERARRQPFPQDDALRRLRELCPDLPYLSGATLKILEILAVLPPPDPPGTAGPVSVHLCEAPGAMAAAADLWWQQRLRRTREGPRQAQWFAVSLASERGGLEMPAGQWFRTTRDRWILGPDGSGDLFRDGTLDALVTAAGGEGRVDLVTADGAIGVDGAAERQEALNRPLLRREWECARRLLRAGSGTLVWKLFSVLEEETVALVSEAALSFEEAALVKPLSSKLTNREVYFVGRRFRLTSTLSSPSPLIAAAAVAAPPAPAPAPAPAAAAAAAQSAAVWAAGRFAAEGQMSALQTSSSWGGRGGGGLLSADDYLSRFVMSAFSK